MPNSSATGGFLAPAATPAPLEDQAFDRFMQQLVAGITGLDGTLVRPRWQEEPPNLPDVGANWAAIGITDQRPETNAYVRHVGTGQGADELYRNEEVDCLVSFYGPKARTYCGVLRDGLQIAQNREVLQLANMGLVDTGDPIPVPSLVKERWLFRIDMRLTIRRQIRRTYPVLNILSAGSTLDNERYLTPIDVTAPA